MSEELYVKKTAEVEDITPSLKTLYSELLEINEILTSTTEKLNYVVKGGSDSKDNEQTPVTGITISMLSDMLSNIRREASDHAILVSSLTGN